MIDEETFNQLVDTAIAGKHREIEILNSLQAKKAAAICLSATKKVIKMFSNAAELSMEEYLRGLKTGDTEVSSLIDYKTMHRCVEFFKEEAKNIKYMLEEFSAYVNSGHIFEMYFLRCARAEEDMYDFIKKQKEDLLQLL